MGTSEVQGELWSVDPSGWARHEQTAGHLWQVMLTLACVTEGTRVLDVGCGAGGALALARARGATCTGLDASPALLAHVARALPGTETKVGDLEELPFADGTFDVVMASNSLQYTADRPRAARELARVKKPGGKVVVGMWAEPDKNQMAPLFARVRGLAPPPPSAAQAPLDLAQRAVLLSLLSGAGLKLVTDLEVPCAFLYTNLEEFFALQLSAGALQPAVRAVGVEKVRDALAEVAASRTASDGRIRFDNTMRAVLAE